MCTVFFLMPYEQCGFGGVIRRRGDAIYALNGCDPDDFRFVLSIIAEHSRLVKKQDAVLHSGEKSRAQRLFIACVALSLQNETAGMDIPCLGK